MTSNVEKMKADLKKFQLTQNKKFKKNVTKDFSKKKEDVIEETKEEIKEEKEEEKDDDEDFFVTRKRNQSFRTRNRAAPKIIEESENSSSEGSKNNSKRNSIEKKGKQIKFAIPNNKTNSSNKKDSLKIKSSNKNDNTENIDNNKSTDTSAAKTNKTLKTQKSKKILKVNDKNNNNNNSNFLTYSMNPISQFGLMKISKEEFFSQIKGVKLKKMVPNKYYNPDEVKKKTKKKTNTSGVDSSSINIKNVKQILEEKLKSRRNFTARKEPKNKNITKPKKAQNNFKYLRKQMDLKSGAKNNNANIKNKRNMPRKSVNVINIQSNLVFNNKVIEFKEGEIQRVKTNKFKNKNYDNGIIIEEEENKKTNRKSIKKKNNTVREERKDSSDSSSSSSSSDSSDSEKKKKEKEEQEKKKKKEREEKKRKEEEEKKKKKEKEEKKRKEKEEEEERKRKEKEEEEERKRKEREEEEERKRKEREEEERKRKEIEEENERKRKEIEEEEERLRIREEQIRKAEERLKKEEERLKKEDERLKKEDERLRKEDERLRKEQEEKLRLLEEENERKRLAEEEENRKRLEEEKKQKEEQEKMENLKKKKEEEMRIKREKEEEERRNKLNNKKPVNESESEADSKSVKDLKRNTKTDVSEPRKSKDTKNNNFFANPFDFHRINTVESNNDNSFEINNKTSIKQKKTKEKITKKKSNRPKMDDFNKFRKSDKNMSDSISFESSDKEKDKKNNKKDNTEINDLNKSVEIRNKNNLFDQFTNFFFNENELKDEKLKNKNKIKNKDKENNINDEQNVTKSFFYHYQNNSTQVDNRVVDKKYEARMKNPGGVVIFNDNNNKFNKENTKKKIRTISILNEDLLYDDNQLLNSSVNKGRNKNNNNFENGKNNTVVYKHKATKSEFQNPIRLNKMLYELNGLNKSTKKINTTKKKIKAVQNLMNDFDYTINDYPQYETINCLTSRDNRKKAYNKYNNKNDKEISKLNIQGNIKKGISKSKCDSERSERHKKKISQELTEYDEKNKNKTNEKNKSKKNILNIDKKANTQILKEKKTKRKISVNDSENSESFYENVKAKKKHHRKIYIKEEDLPLYTGEIDYRFTSANDIPETINDLMARYKKKGYTCVKKGDTFFKFIKGSKTHKAELTKLGNGLLYFKISKKKKKV